MYLRDNTVIINVIKINKIFSHWYQMYIFFIVLIINFSAFFGINAQNFRSRSHYRPNYEIDYYDDSVSFNERPATYQQQINRLEEQIELKDSYISRLEYRINKMKRNLRKEEDSPQYDYPNREDISYYAGSKSTFPHESDEKRTNEEMMDKIIPKISARMPEANCMRSCNFLKNVKAAKDALSQYMYLMVCAEGCRKSIPCLNENYCMPVMKENPDFFIQCVNKCELFKIAPKVFKSGKCK